MRRCLAVLLLAAGVWSTAGVGYAAAQGEDSEHGIGFPDQWSAWDEDDDGQLGNEELIALTDGDWDDFRAWAQDQLEENGGDVTDREMRDWVRAHADSSDLDSFFAPEVYDMEEPINTRERLGLAGEGWRGDDVDDTLETAGSATEDAWETATGIPAEAVTGIPGSIASRAFEAIANGVGEAAASLVSWVGSELAQTGSPSQLDADWYQEHYQRMLGWAGLLMVPLAMVAIGGAVTRGQTAQIGETLLEIPAAYVLGVVAVGLVAAASGLAQAMAESLTGDISDSSTQLGENVGALFTVQTLANPGTVLVLGLVVAAAALVTAIWLLLTEAAIYGVVLFVPLAFAGRVWPATKGWGRKLLTLAFSLVAAKVVIFALWALAVDGLANATETFAVVGGGGESVPLRSALALAALLVMTAISPVAVLRLVPMLEGVETAGSPGKIAGQGLSATHQVSGLTTRLGSFAGGGRAGAASAAGGSGGGRLPVSSGAETSASLPVAPSARGPDERPGPPPVANQSDQGGRPPSEGSGSRAPASSTDQQVDTGEARGRSARRGGPGRSSGGGDQGRPTPPDGRESRRWRRR